MFNHSNIPTISIDFDYLLKLSQENENTESNNLVKGKHRNRKDKRRPDLEIYRPSSSLVISSQEKRLASRDKKEKNPQSDDAHCLSKSFGSMDLKTNSTSFRIENLQEESLESKIKEPSVSKVDNNNSHSTSNMFGKQKRPTMPTYVPRYRSNLSKEPLISDSKETAIFYSDSPELIHDPQQHEIHLHSCSNRQNCLNNKTADISSINTVQDRQSFNNELNTNSNNNTDDKVKTRSKNSSTKLKSNKNNLVSDTGYRKPKNSLQFEKNKKTEQHSSKYQTQPCVNHESQDCDLIFSNDKKSNSLISPHSKSKENSSSHGYGDPSSPLQQHTRKNDLHFLSLKNSISLKKFHDKRLSGTYHRSLENLVDFPTLEFTNSNLSPESEVTNQEFHINNETKPKSIANTHCFKTFNHNHRNRKISEKSSESHESAEWNYETENCTEELIHRDQNVQHGVSDTNSHSKNSTQRSWAKNRHERMANTGLKISIDSCANKSDNSKNQQRIHSQSPPKQLPKSENKDDYQQDRLSQTKSSSESTIKAQKQKNTMNVKANSINSSSTCRKIGTAGILCLPKENFDNSVRPSNIQSPKSQVECLKSTEKVFRSDNYLATRGNIRNCRRGSSRRSLYDPNNPNKNKTTQLTQDDLYFKETQPVFEKDFSFSNQNTFYENPAAISDSYNYRGVNPNISYDCSSHQFYPLTFQYGPLRMSTEPFEAFTRDNQFQRNLTNYLEGGRTDRLFRECLDLDHKLSNLLARRIESSETLQTILKLRNEISSLYRHIILSDPDFTKANQVEALLWKSSFYQVIEVFRRNLREQEEVESLDEILITKEHLNHLLDEGIAFFESLIENIQTSSRFTLDEFLDPNVAPPENPGRTVLLSILSVHKCLIYLGDIARYREQTNHSTSYGRARSYYLKAQLLAPKDGRPYNQLAILALYTRRKLDAVYYYMRSLAASNPFLTARESLLSLFDEVRKKADFVAKQEAEKALIEKSIENENQDTVASLDNHRVEVWIPLESKTADLSSKVLSFPETLTQMTSVELNKKFILSYLNVQGKCFSKIGLDSFEEIGSRMLYEFKALLSHSPSPIGNTRLLQLVCINMFSIQNILDTDQVKADFLNKDSGYRAKSLDQIVSISLDMCTLVVVQCCHLLTEHLAVDSSKILNDELHQLLPCVKVFSDWMMCHLNLWNPPPVQIGSFSGPLIDVWQSFANLFNLLKKIEIGYIKFYGPGIDGCERVSLPEDIMVAGFVPLLSLPEDPLYIHSTVDKDVARDCLRVNRLQRFADYLCGIDSPLLNYDVQTHSYVSAAPPVVFHQANLQKQDSEISQCKSEESSDVELEDSDTESAGEEDNENLQSLRSRKKELKRQIKENEDRETKLQKILSNGVTKTLLRIKPRYLIPDTNCFVEHFVGMQKLIMANQYSIVVPLIVINELDGLSRGASSQIEHQRKASHQMALKSIKFLESSFVSKKYNLKALTAKGSILDSISIRSEEITEKGNNDDRILSCCFHYFHDNPRNFMPRSTEQYSPITLYREVVLITNDRNLRLKAHAHNVPVKSLPAFLRWSKIG